MGDPKNYDQRWVEIHDCTQNPGFTPSLRHQGFSHADLSQRTRLQRVFAQVREAQRLDPAAISQIRRNLIGSWLRLADGSHIWMLFIAAEGFLMRMAGPNRTPIAREDSTQGSNGHDAAMAVHADQDVEGTPVRQILRGMAPWLFHHHSPYRRNRVSPLHLVNIWVPLDQVTRPLAIMDASTLDRERHQLRYGLPTDHFLSRRDDMRVNDIWTFLHGTGQRWFVTPGMTCERAYVFETLSTPHGAIVLPGEARAAVLYRRLLAALTAVEVGEQSLVDALAGPVPQTPEPVTAPLRAAIGQMQQLVDETLADAAALCSGDNIDSWRQRVCAATSRVVRKSIEMRAVVVRIPGFKRRGANR